jgi:hypothetical protein
VWLWAHVEADDLRGWLRRLQEASADASGEEAYFIVCTVSAVDFISNENISDYAMYFN